ncbi:MAG: hybrid sensor histidine kinase/response regulator [Elusimicrobia bacterium]|nr:hybrid sensor histidine kinase/response regulator [Elusimicrobiota bacterium]
MADIKGRVLVVTTGKTLLDEITPSMSGRGLELVCVPTLNYAAARLGAGDCSALVVDFGQVAPAEREAFLELHKQYLKVHLFTLETIMSIAPGFLSPLRRLSWPLPMGFADQVRVTDRSVIILADQTMFMTGAVQSAFQQAGVQAVSLESTTGLIEFIRQQTVARISASQPSKPKNFWSRLAGDEEKAAPAAPPFLGQVVVAQFTGTPGEADALDSRIRSAIPAAACYIISGMDTARYAVQALKDGRPVALPREQAGRIAGILVDISEGGASRSKEKEKERIILLDNFKPNLTTLGQALLNAGYEVTTSMNGEDALRLCKKGAFHLAVIGTSATSAQYSGSELAQKLRERDPDLRIIFMVDQYPLKAALQGVSQVVELGLDDALLKPVESSRLVFSVERALERRFLLLENARLLKEVQEFNRQLAQVNSFQTKFFAMVTHDVKSPLTAILGYAEVLTKKLKSLPGELKYASNIHSSAKTLNVLISDLVDLAAIESGKLRVEIGTLNLLSVVQDVRARVEIAAQKRNISFAVQVPPVLPPLAGDDARIGQVIQNLCTNAIQYTNEGGQVTIMVESAPDSVVVGVIDTGIGISKEDLPRVWERFFQTEEAQKMRQAGFGLGLKIAREIVQRHGGEMGIESELGVGSRFFFHLPIKK